MVRLTYLELGELICIVSLLIVFCRHLGRWVKSSLRRGHAASNTVSHHLSTMLFRAHVILIEVRRVCLFLVILAIVLQLRELVAVVVSPVTSVVLIGMPL